LAFPVASSTAGLSYQRVKEKIMMVSGERQAQNKVITEESEMNIREVSSSAEETVNLQHYKMPECQKKLSKNSE
jgi:hypothetical protein